MKQIGKVRSSWFVEKWIPASAGMTGRITRGVGVFHHEEQEGQEEKIIYHLLHDLQGLHGEII